jgi:RNA polymerase sigma factor (sigma-70 family)
MPRPAAAASKTIGHGLTAAGRRANELAAAWKSAADPDDRRRIEAELVEHCKGFSHAHVVHFLMRRPVPAHYWPDFHQESRLAVLDALARWDARRGAFLTALYQWTFSRLSRHYASATTTIKVAVYAQNRVKADDGDERRATKAAAAKARFGVGSLSALERPDDYEGMPVARDRVLDELIRREEAAHVGAILRDALDALMNPKAREAVVLRFGLHGGPGLTYAALGEALGISHERARQLVKESLPVLRRTLERRYPDANT